MEAIVYLIIISHSSIIFKFFPDKSTNRLPFGKRFTYKVYSMFTMPAR